MDIILYTVAMINMFSHPSGEFPYQSGLLDAERTTTPHWGTGCCHFIQVCINIWLKCFGAVCHFKEVWETCCSWINNELKINSLWVFMVMVHGNNSEQDLKKNPHSGLCEGQALLNIWIFYSQSFMRCYKWSETPPPHRLSWWKYTVLTCDGDFVEC